MKRTPHTGRPRQVASSGIVAVVFGAAAIMLLAPLGQISSELGPGQTTTGFRTLTGSPWATLATDEATFCLQNTSSTNSSQHSYLWFEDTMLSHVSNGPGCPAVANYGVASTLRNNTTGQIVSLLLMDFVDTSGNQSFQSMDAYYVPIIGTGISSTVEFDISCPSQPTVCSVSQVGGSSNAISTQNATASQSSSASPAGCSIGGSFSTGWIGSAASINQCATLAVVASIAFIALLVGFIGLVSSGIGVVIGAAIGLGAAYIAMIDAWGGGNGVWFALASYQSCSWSWWSYHCHTFVTGAYWVWYNPVWTPWY